MATETLMKMSIKKNDQVQVIAGREKGKTGKVLRVCPKTGRIVVEKLNLVKRHVRPSQKNPGGGVLQKEAPLHYSNVLLLCPKCNRGVRHGIRFETQASSKTFKKGKSAQGTTEEGKQIKIRVCKRCGEQLSSV